MCSGLCVVCVYLDDILIFTETLEEHQQLMWIVLECLHHHKLYLHPKKCELERTKIEYLGLIVSQGWAEMDLVKVAGVTNWPIPLNQKEVQSFLGFVNFYWRLIGGFLEHACPLFKLTKKDAKWAWGTAKQKAFEGLKKCFTLTPILWLVCRWQPAIPGWSRQFGCSHRCSAFTAIPWGWKWHPIAFYSKSLSVVEWNYKIHDKEMLAIICALEEWTHFLEGVKCHVKVWTDHKNLEYFWMAKKLNQSVMFYTSLSFSQFTKITVTRYI